MNLSKRKAYKYFRCYYIDTRNEYPWASKHELWRATSLEIVKTDLYGTFIYMCVER